MTRVTPDPGEMRSPAVEFYTDLLRPVGTSSWRVSLSSVRRRSGSRADSGAVTCLLGPDLHEVLLSGLLSTGRCLPPSRTGRLTGVTEERGASRPPLCRL